jgi:hypothetical protein
VVLPTLPASCDFLSEVDAQAGLPLSGARELEQALR